MDKRIISSKRPSHILSLIARFESFSEEAYAVGGSLRDILLGIPPHDFDLATSALPERTLEIFSDMRVIETGIKHGTVTVITEGEPMEITTFRIDGSYTDSRHPDGVSFTRSIEEDLSRRDFTVNAMAFSPVRGLIDPFLGRNDLERRMIRAVGDPEKRFSEDALRIMRAFRFSAQLGFDIYRDTLLGASRTKNGLSCIARERIATELLKLLLSADPTGALLMMAEGDILPYAVGSYAPSERILNKLCKMPANDVSRLGFFLCEADPDEARDILRSLKYSNKQITGALAVARGACVTVGSEADARRFIANTGAYAEEAIEASVLMGSSEPSALQWVKSNRAPCTLSQLALTGRELISIGIEGKAVGKTLDRLLEAVIEDPSLNTKEELTALAEKLKDGR